MNVRINITNHRRERFHPKYWNQNPRRLNRQAMRPGVIAKRESLVWSHAVSNRAQSGLGRILPFASFMQFGHAEDLYQFAIQDLVQHPVYFHDLGGFHLALTIKGGSDVYRKNTLNALVNHNIINPSTITYLFDRIRKTRNTAENFAFFMGAYAWMSFYGYDIKESFQLFSEAWNDQYSRSHRSNFLKSINEYLEVAKPHDGHLLFEGAMGFVLQKKEHPVDVLIKDGMRHGDWMMYLSLPWRLKQLGLQTRALHTRGSVPMNLLDLYEGMPVHQLSRIKRRHPIHINLGVDDDQARDHEYEFYTNPYLGNQYWASAPYWGPDCFAEHKTWNLGHCHTYISEASLWRHLDLPSPEVPQTDPSCLIPTEWNGDPIVVINPFSSNGFTPTSNRARDPEKESFDFWFELISNLKQLHPNTKFILQGGSNRRINNWVLQLFKNAFGDDLSYAGFPMLSEVKKLLSDERVTCIICPDTMTHHLAGAFSNRPVVYFAGTQFNIASHGISNWRSVLGKVNAVFARNNSDIKRLAGYVAHHYDHKSTAVPSDHLKSKIELLKQRLIEFISLEERIFLHYMAKFLRELVHEIENQRSLTDYEAESITSILTRIPTAVIQVESDDSPAWEKNSFKSITTQGINLIYQFFCVRLSLSSIYYEFT